MDNKEYEFVTYQPEYKDQIIKLQSYLWGDDLSKNRSYFEWKYERNPYYSNPIIYLALHEGKCVSMRGLIASNWQSGDNPNSSKIWLALSDSVTHPQHRRKGLFSRISEIALDDLSNSSFEYILNLSSGPLSTSGNLKLGWQSIGNETTSWLNLQKYHEFQKSAFRKAVSNLPLISPIYRRISRWITSSVNTNQEFSQISPFSTIINFIGTQNIPNIKITKTPDPVLIAEFIIRNSRQGRIRHVRDETFFRWRYKNPRSEYVFILLESNKLEGYITLRRSVYPFRSSVQIVDWEVSKTEYLADLIKVAIEYGKIEKLTITTTTLGKKEMQQLDEIGFEPLNQEDGFIRPSLLINSLKQETPQTNWIFSNLNMLDANNWDLRDIYADGF